MDNKKLKILAGLIILICALTVVTAVSSAPTATNDDKNTDENYTLEINTSGKWRLDLVVDGNYSSCEAEGSKIINLNTTDLKYASVTLNQKSGPTDVFIKKGNETRHEDHSNGNGIETIYFYFEEGK
ncbi:hypothetical protein [Methanobrevibacter millerae]|uniref:Uncharacterized protein n=1 Tax=Methanobrevibacter millerae TaxID=230361 RepID=A0A1G5VJA1_9EURY|nr:hypothetical protein [Methanobrevibacter millerae]SDA45963.1 hypothetical protein SAMN02910315_00672 [Methanobrevibacter millerae]